jgi:hypothetical protein
MKVAKVMGWLLLATFLLVLLLYLILVAINWNDRPPSAAVRRFDEIVAQRPAVSADDNAVVYIMGFGAPTEGDPVDAGARRMQWLESFDDSTSPDSDPLREGLSLPAVGSPVVAHLGNACGPEADRLQCASVFESIARDWQPSDMDALALRRYEALLTRRAWRDVVPLDVAAPLPAYGNVTHAQRLYLLRLGQWAAQGRMDDVRAGLEADLDFWRTAVPASDSLIGQMIAVAALRQHFALANLILRGLSPEQAVRAVPADWSREFSPAERSMKRVMAGEMAFWKEVMAHTRRQQEGAALAIAEDMAAAPTLLEKLTSQLTDPLFKIQDTANGVADRRMRLCEAFDAPMNQYLRLQNTWDATPMTDGMALYNPVGQMILRIEEGSTYVGYVLRTASVEGVRRAALLAFQLHANGVAPEAVGSLVAQSDLRDPYTEKPFEWNAERHSVTFAGPENHRARRSEFFY